MFDGRETIQPLNNAATFRANLITDLMHQSVSATVRMRRFHTTTDQQTAIVEFRTRPQLRPVLRQLRRLLSITALVAALIIFRAGYHPAPDSLGKDPGQPFNPAATFTLFDSWANSRPSFSHSAIAMTPCTKRIAADRFFQHSPAHHHPVFAASMTQPACATPIAPFTGNCTTCHDTPNVGNHSFPLPLDIGTGHNPAYESDPLIAAGVSLLDFPDLPVYQINGCPNPFARRPPPQTSLHQATELQPR
jgi:hypothetical protein